MAVRWKSSGGAAAASQRVPEASSKRSVQDAAFVATRGVRVQAVMTDRAWGYTRATAFRTGLVQLGARHLVIPDAGPRAPLSQQPGPPPEAWERVSGPAAGVDGRLSPRSVAVRWKSPRMG